MLDGYNGKFDYKAGSGISCWQSTTTSFLVLHSLWEMYSVEKMCLRKCTWSSGWFRLTTFCLRFNSHRGSFAHKVEQVVNLLCAQVNATSYPQRDRK